MGIATLTEPQVDKTAYRLNMRVELDKLEALLFELKTQYEMYFTSILPLPPTKLHDEVKRTIRTLIDAPFKSSEINFKLRSLRSRYSTFDTYIQRVLQEREAGTYHRDVFKAEVRERTVVQDAYAQTRVGKAEQGIKDLFANYSRALESQDGGQSVKLDYEKFRDSLSRRAAALKEKLGVEKMTFKVVVKDGRVTLKAKPKK